MNKYDVIENCVPITLSKGEADAVFFSDIYICQNSVLNIKN